MKSINILIFITLNNFFLTKMVRHFYLSFLTLCWCFIVSFLLLILSFPFYFYLCFFGSLSFYLNCCRKTVVPWCRYWYIIIFIIFYSSYLNFSMFLSLTCLVLLILLLSFILAFLPILFFYPFVLCSTFLPDKRQIQKIVLHIFSIFFSLFFFN